MTAAGAQAARGLTPDEVLVVANANDADSLALAKFYAQQRGIGEQNIVLIKTRRGYQVFREDYDAQIRQPLRQILDQRKEKGTIRCLALMYGVPVRIVGSKDRKQGDLLSVYRTRARRAHYRLAVDFALLESVGKDFPAPRTRGLTPIGKLFAPRMPEPPEPLTAVPKLKEGIAAALDRRQEQVVALFDPSRRHVASRQLMALHLDLYGLEGLIDHITTHRPGGAPDVQALRDELAQAQRELAEAAKKEPTKDNVRRHLDLMARIHGVSFVCPHLNQRIATIEQPESEASVDSELALLRWDEHKLSGWLANPLHWRIPDAKRRTVPPVLMTARIDGPTAGDATNIIRASVAAEKAGLRGTFYIDAGGGAKVKAARYDEHLRNLHRFVRSHTRLKVVLDSNAAVFAPGSCPDAALYVGWYSLRKYVPAFTWRPGAVGWHIASFEAEDLRNAKSTRWCARMIQEGVAATIGAVMEPRLMAFPLPQEFFGLLLTGRYTIAECYWRTTTVVSWRMTLIADPLYNPFKANPQVCPEALPPGLAP